MAIDIEDIFKKHMENCIYATSCSECGDDINVDIDSVDSSDFDLTLQISPCDKCMDEAREEGRNGN